MTAILNRITTNIADICNRKITLYQEITMPISEQRKKPKLLSLTERVIWKLKSLKMRDSLNALKLKLPKQPRHNRG